DPGVVILDNSAVGIDYDVNANVNGTDGGVYATETGTGPVRIDVLNNAKINGDTDADLLTGDGVNISATTGLVTVTSAAGTAIAGVGGINIDTTFGPVKVTTDGTVTATSGNGIDVLESDPLSTGDLEVTANGVIDAT